MKHMLLLMELLDIIWQLIYFAPDEYVSHVAIGRIHTRLVKVCLKESVPFVMLGENFSQYLISGMISEH